MMVFRRVTALVFVSFFTVPALGATRDPLSVTEAHRRDAVAHYLKAKVHASESEFEEAIKELKKAIELDPEDGNLRREFAELLRDLAIYPEAQVQARKAIELGPGNPGAHRILGQILLANVKERKDVEAAAAELKIANEAMPYDPVGALSYGQALLRLGKADEAATALEKVLDKGRGSAIAPVYGEALGKSRRLKDAEELFEAILPLDPENRAAAVGLLQVYELSRQFDKAIPIVEAFLKAQPGNVNLRIEYGSTLLRARRYTDATKVFQEVLKADPGNRDALRQYGTLLSETRETDKADEVFRRLQELEPEDADDTFRRALNFFDARRLSELE